MMSLWVLVIIVTVFVLRIDLAVITRLCALILSEAALPY